ncbi:hypothetical protein BELL_0136g00060 [Botrytis elliptica]|uniref:Uncharacterized protein n=1 Tax=Botrytis elliptica TaxID=278938 RepID=A0A4Z1JSN8_9HELO|nr:hypothetical protein BELL_0136g00060 [Botrytis elliptica]
MLLERGVNERSDISRVASKDEIRTEHLTRLLRYSMYNSYLAGGLSYCIYAHCENVNVKCVEARSDDEGRRSGYEPLGRYL